MSSLINRGSVSRSTAQYRRTSRDGGSPSVHALHGSATSCDRVDDIPSGRGQHPVTDLRGQPRTSRYEVIGAIEHAPFGAPADVDHARRSDSLDMPAVLPPARCRMGGPEHRGQVAGESNRCAIRAPAQSAGIGRAYHVA